MNHKRNIKYLWGIFIFGFFCSAIFLFCPHPSFADYTYTPMERIPGFESAATDFPNFLLSLYKFSIWIIGICALLMVTVGGFMYLVSAGNTSKMDTAKTLIKDAILGLIIALGAYFLLFTINPDLVNLNISLKPFYGAGSSGVSTGSNVFGTGAGNGTCTPVTTGACAPENLKSACSWDAQKASAICNAESGGSEKLASKVDKCTDGNPFSFGLFQINLTCQCKDAFTPVKSSGCVNKACTVSNKPRYTACVATYTTASSNIAKACEIYKSQGWKGWGANSKCGF
jgi:hypothetical protein